MATLLRSSLENAIAEGSIKGLDFTQPTQANAVFATIPNTAADALRQSVRFYDWDRARGEVRWMCSFDTTEEDIAAFVGLISDTLGKA